MVPGPFPDPPHTKTPHRGSCVSTCLFSSFLETSRLQIATSVTVRFSGGSSLRRPFRSFQCLERVRQKWIPVLSPDTRKNKRLESVWRFCHRQTDSSTSFAPTWDDRAPIWAYRWPHLYKHGPREDLCPQTGKTLPDLGTTLALRTNCRAFVSYSRSFRRRCCTSCRCRCGPACSCRNRRRGRLHSLASWL